MRRGSEKAPAGFTLVELLTVVAIIAILAGLLLPVLAGFSRERLRTRAENDLSNAGLAVKMMKDEYDYDDVLGIDTTGKITNTLDEAIFMELDPNNPTWAATYKPYLNSRKKQYFPLKSHHVQKVGGQWKVVDPWGEPYQYRVVEVTQDLDTYYVEKIWSWGPDRTDATVDDIVRVLEKRLKKK